MEEQVRADWKYKKFEVDLKYRDDNGVMQYNNGVLKSDLDIADEAGTELIRENMKLKEEQLKLKAEVEKLERVDEAISKRFRIAFNLLSDVEFAKFTVQCWEEDEMKSWVPMPLEVRQAYSVVEKFKQ
jgi:hypothetical protein